jgi:glutamate-1-semialdehyde 2,1-aminomutase
MQLGGLHHNRHRVFLLSTTNGAETHSMAAAIETIRIYKSQQVIPRLYRQGRRLADGINRAVQANRLQDHFQLLGRPCNMIYATRDQHKQRSQAFRTLFLQETVKRGLIAPSFVVSFSHSDADVDRTIEAVAQALGVYRRALDEGIENYLVGRPVKPVNRRLN